MDDSLEYLQKSLDQKGYVRSGEAQKTRHDLKARWDKMMDPENPEDGEEGRQWREDYAKLKSEWTDFDKALRAHPLAPEALMASPVAQAWGEDTLRTWAAQVTEAKEAVR